MVAVLLGVLLLTLLLGVPIAFGMGLAAALWIVFVEGLEPSILVRRMYGIMSTFPLLSIPLFTMIGALAERCGLLPELVKWLQMLLGRLRGGMAYINVANSMVMGGVSGTAVSDVASLGRIEIQVMKRAGYPASYAAALTASTAVIAPIIPPSVAMIIYALAAGGVSIGGLFMAGIVPGLIMGLGLWVMAWFKSRRANFGHRLDRPEARVILHQTFKVLPFLVLPVIIVGGIISGIFTVTESAAVGVTYVLLIGFFVTRSLSLKDVYETVLYSSVISSVVGLLLGTGAILSWILTRNRVTQELADFLATVTTDPTLFMVIVAVALLCLGMIMDVTAMMIALAPLLVPIARQYGIPDLQFGVVFVLSCMIGMITPPVGILLFMTASLAEISLEDVYLAILPFVLASFVLVALLILFPPLTLWVPSLFGFR
jgi:tripartite ATP-independent transporter DctM subunit